MPHRSVQQPEPSAPAGPVPMPEIPGVPVTHETYRLSFGRMHVARAGDPAKPAILLVHGFPQHWWCWHGVAAQLAGEAQLVMPDLRGAGWSDVPSGAGRASKRAAADDLVELLDAMGIDRIAVVGHDWGGFVSQLAALRHPGRIRRLLALSIPPVVPGPTPPLRSMLRFSYQLAFAAPFSDRVVARTIARSLRQDVQRRESFTRQHAGLYARSFRDPARAKFAQATYRSFLLGDAAAIFRETKGARFAMPVRFVLSAHDAYIPPAYAASVGRLGEEVDGFVQDRTGHFVGDEDPGYVAGLIRDWVLPHAAPIGG